MFAAPPEALPNGNDPAGFEPKWPRYRHPRDDQRMDASIDLLHRTLDLLACKDVHCWVFGGWAEELHGLGAARAHQDVDLLCVADDFTAVDLLLRDHPQLHEIHDKRFAHKRAFELDDVCVELFLVQHDDNGYFTTFWGQRHDWPGDVLSSASQLPVASITALRNYRAHWRALQHQP